MQSASLVNAALAGTGRIDDAFLDAVADLLDTNRDEVSRVTRAAIRTLDSGDLPLQMHTGAWTLDVPAASVKAISCAVLTTIVLAGLGAESVPATVLSIVAPFLFEIDRVEVGADDIWVHGHLHAAAGSEPTHLAELYHRLPDHVRAELSVREFVGVIERLQAARLVNVSPEGVYVHATGHRHFRLLLR